MDFVFRFSVLNGHFSVSLKYPDSVFGFKTGHFSVSLKYPFSVFGFKKGRFSVFSEPRDPHPQGKRRLFYNANEPI